MKYKEVSMRAGVAKVEITYGEVGEPAYAVSEKVRAHIPKELWDKKVAIDDPLYLKALVLESGECRLVWVTMDVTSIGSRTITQEILGDSADDFVARLRERLSVEAGMGDVVLTVSASHTHPPGRLLCGDEEQLDRAVWAVEEAMRNMVPVQVCAGSAHQDRLTFNRTLLMKNGTDYSIRGCNPLPPDEEVEGLRPIDPEVGVLRIDREDGSPFAILYNFASHLLVGSPFGNLSADFPGVTSSYLESRLGSGSMAFFVQGAGGDISEIHQLDREHPRWGPAFGIELAQSVIEGYQAALPVSPVLRQASVIVEFPFRTDISETVAKLRAEQIELLKSLRYTNLDFKTFLPLYLRHELHPDYPLHSAYRYLQAKACGDPGYQVLAQRCQGAIKKYLGSLRSMEQMARNEEKIETLLKQQEVIKELGGAGISAEIQCIRIGEVGVVTAPMEMLAETGLRLKQISPFRQTFVSSISNGYLHYAPPASYYPRGGYEVTECLLSPQWESLFFEAVQKLFVQVMLKQRRQS